MSELFGEYKRPKAEKKLIEKIIRIYNKSKLAFKNKNYSDALVGLENAYNLLLEIWDKFPKIITLYSIMKGYFYTKQYDKCKSILEQLEKMIQSISKEKTDIFIKIKSKIFFYKLMLYFIHDDIDNSIGSIINMIKYLMVHPSFTLEEKSKFFWNYIKSLLKIGGITKSNKFLLFKEGYDSMIVEQVNISNNDDEKNSNPGEEGPVRVKKVNRFMLETYKNFMNSKLRTLLYELLDKEFYFVKYHKTNDKVMAFMHKNIHIFVRDNNKERLMILFHTFLVLNKLDLKKEYNMTMNEFVFEQKRRIEAFDIIFSNLVGAFNHIFRKYFADEIPNMNNKTRGNSNFKNIKINLKDIKNLIKIKIQSPKKEKKFRLKEKAKEEESSDENKNNKTRKKVGFKSVDKCKTIKKEREREREKEYDSIDFVKEIKVPPITETTEAPIKIEDYRTKKNYWNNKLKIKDHPRLGITISNCNKNSKKNFFLRLPNITENKMKSIKTESKRSGLNPKTKILNFKKQQINFLQKKIIENEVENVSKFTEEKNAAPNKFKIRNINNYLLTKIIETFKLVNNMEHDIPLEKTVDLSLVYPRKKDIYDFNIPNYIDSYSAITVKGTKLENQDDYYYYENYFLIQNLTFFGVCDGHGENGAEISQHIPILFASYLFYILLDDNLIQRKMDINKLIYKLIKIQESPDDIKNMFLFRYFFNKFEIDFSYISIINGNQKLFYNQIYEALSYSKNDLFQRYEIGIKDSGTTLCSGFLYGNILYIINIGDSRAVLGTSSISSNKWKSTQLSVDHKPNETIENKRIFSCNGRVDRLKNDLGDEYGPYRVFERDMDSTYPGLAISRSIGDEDAQKLGVIYEPDMFKYELKVQDKILVFASDGLWDQLSNDEVINIVGKCYNNDIKCEEAANILIENAKKKAINKYKSSSKNSIPDESYKVNKSEEEIKMNLDNIVCIVIYLNIR